jgi:hypothetical protein
MSGAFSMNGFEGERVEVIGRKARERNATRKA